jgi:hypothetical protein
MRHRQGFALDPYGWVLVMLSAIFSVVVLITAGLDPAQPSAPGSSRTPGTEAVSAFAASGGLVADSTQIESESQETLAHASYARPNPLTLAR